MHETTEHFRSLYGDHFDGLLWVGGFLADKGGARHGRFVSSAREAAEHALTIDTEHGEGLAGVYHSFALFDPDKIRERQKTTRGTRGTEADVRSMVAMFADLDVQTGAHKTANTLPPTLEAGMEVIRRVMPDPTKIIFSGGGYYPVWRFAEPITISGPEEMREVKLAYRELHLKIIQEMKAAGYHLDSTFDLARVYRVPGTLNRKAETPVRARIERNSGPLIAPDFLRTWMYGGVRSAGQGHVQRTEQDQTGEATGYADDPFVTASQVAGWVPPSDAGGSAGAGAEGHGSTPWTQEQAESAIARQLQRMQEATEGINTAFGGAARYVGHFVPEFLPQEEARERLLEAAAGNARHDDAWNAANGLSWTAASVIDTALARGMSEPYARRQEVVLTKPAPPEPVAADEVEALLAEMLTFDEVSRQAPPEPLIEGLLALDSEAWMIGAPGSKKSFVALDMAAHVALGLTWRGHAVTQGPVVMIVAEGAGGMTLRTRAWERHHGLTPGSLIRVLPRPVQAADRHAWGVLVEACRRLGPLFVIVDTQARVTVGLEENSAKDMGHYVDAVGTIRQATGACVLSIHHTGRNGGDARGSSAIDGAQYTELKVDVASGALHGLLLTEKQKDLEQGPPLPLRFVRVDLGQDEKGRARDSLVLTEADPFVTAAGLEGPEPWERFHGETQVRLIKVLRDQGGTIGLTKAEARTNVVERFCGGDPKKLARSTWTTAWTKVLEKSTRAGDPIAVNTGGQRWVIDPIALDDLAAEAEKLEG